MGIVEDTSCNDPIALIVKINRSDEYFPLETFIFLILGEGIAETATDIAAESETESLHRTVVDTECSGVRISYFELVWRAGSSLDEVFCAETVRVKTREEKKFIFPRFVPSELSPKFKTDLVPRQGKIVFSPSWR